MFYTGVNIGQLLRAFRLYEARPPGSKSMSAVRNLIASFSGERQLQQEQSEMASTAGLFHTSLLKSVKGCMA